MNLEHNLITIQHYAKKHKISTFAVIKLINAKKLKTSKKIENGEEIEYIVDDTVSTVTAKIEEATSTEKVLEKGAINYEVEFHKLLEKYIELQDKYTKILETSVK